MRDIREKDKQITLKIPIDMYNDLLELRSIKGDVPMAKVIRWALEDYISRCKIKGLL